MSGRLDPTFSGTSKILFDVVTVVDRLAEEALPEGDLDALLDTPVDVERIIRFAEESGAFIGSRGVCAAPDSMVRDALRTLVSPGPDSAGFAEGFEQALGNREAFFRFAEAFFAMDIACCSYQFLASDLAQSLVESLGGLSEEALAPLGRNVLGALGQAIQALPDLDFVVLPEPRRRRIIELHAHYLQRLGLVAPASSPPAADAPHTLPEAREFSPALQRLIAPVLVSAIQLEHRADRDLRALAQEVKAAIGWEREGEPEWEALLTRWLGIDVARVLHQACESEAAARASNGEAT